MISSAEESKRTKMGLRPETGGNCLQGTLTNSGGHRQAVPLVLLFAHLVMMVCGKWKTGTDRPPCKPTLCLWSLSPCLLPTHPAPQSPQSLNIYHSEFEQKTIYLKCITLSPSHILNKWVAAPWNPRS